MAVGRQYEAQRHRQMRREPQPVTPGANRFAHTRQIQPLQMPQPAMQCPQAVARSSATEVGRLDQCDPETGQRGLPGYARSMNSPADHQYVVFLQRQARRITPHGPAPVTVQQLPAQIGLATTETP